MKKGVNDRAAHLLISGIAIIFICGRVLISESKGRLVEEMPTMEEIASTPANISIIGVHEVRRYNISFIALFGALTLGGCFMVIYGASQWNSQWNEKNK